MLRREKNTKEQRKEMERQNIVVTFTTPPEEKALFREMLGSEASLTFLDEIPPMQRQQALEDATILLAWNFPREIQPQDYPHLQQVRFIQLLSAGADHMPFAGLPSHLLVENQKLLHDLERVLRESDVVVISLPLTKATRGLIGKEGLTWMKADAILVNVARGAIIDEEALYTHVKNHPTFLLGI